MVPVCHALSVLKSSELKINETNLVVPGNQDIALPDVAVNNSQLVDPSQRQLTPVQITKNRIPALNGLHEKAHNATGVTLKSVAQKIRSSRRHGLSQDVVGTDLFCNALDVRRELCNLQVAFLVVDNDTRDLAFNIRRHSGNLQIVKNRVVTWELVTGELVGWEHILFRLDLASLREDRESGPGLVELGKLAQDFHDLVVGGSVGMGKHAAVRNRHVNNFAAGRGLAENAEGVVVDPVRAGEKVMVGRHVEEFGLKVDSGRLVGRARGVDKELDAHESLFIPAGNKEIR